jgi:hypothetical protein
LTLDYISHVQYQAMVTSKSWRDFSVWNPSILRQRFCHMHAIIAPERADTP